MAVMVFSNVDRSGCGGGSVAKIQRDDFRSRYLNFFEVTKDSKASSRPGSAAGRARADRFVADRRRRPGPMVVRGRESRSHGEGAQPVFAATESTGEEMRL